MIKKNIFFEKNPDLAQKNIAIKPKKSSQKLECVENNTNEI